MMKTIITKNEAWSRVQFTLNTGRNFPHICTEEELRSRNGTAVTPTLEGYELNVVHDYQQMLEEVFKCLKIAFNETNYDVVCGEEQPYGRNKWKMMIYVEKEN